MRVVMISRGILHLLLPFTVSKWFLNVFLDTIGLSNGILLTLQFTLLGGGHIMRATCTQQWWWNNLSFSGQR